VKCAPFEYVRAASVDEAVKALVDADGEGKLLAGGQSLVPVLALRMARPSVLVDVNRVPGRAGIRPEATAQTPPCASGR
jgi:carbon-monoxide dehydrogenase medium subunit